MTRWLQRLAAAAELAVAVVVTLLGAALPDPDDVPRAAGRADRLVGVAQAQIRLVGEQLDQVPADRLERIAVDFRAQTRRLDRLASTRSLDDAALAATAGGLRQLRGGVRSMRDDAAAQQANLREFSRGMTQAAKVIDRTAEPLGRLARTQYPAAVERSGLRLNVRMEPVWPDGRQVLGELADTAAGLRGAGAAAGRAADGLPQLLAGAGGAVAVLETAERQVELVRQAGPELEAARKHWSEMAATAAEVVTATTAGAADRLRRERRLLDELSEGLAATRTGIAVGGEQLRLLLATTRYLAWLVAAFAALHALHLLWSSRPAATGNGTSASGSEGSDRDSPARLA